MTCRLEGRGRYASSIALNVDLSVAPDLQIQPLRQRVHDRHTHTVETTRNLVRGIVELAAGVELGQYDFRSRFAFLWHNLGRNTPAVVDDRYGIVDVNDDVNFSAESGKRFVDRIIDDFVH